MTRPPGVRWNGLMARLFPGTVCQVEVVPPVTPKAALPDAVIGIARRNQVLLSRQLAVMDQLERAEENPSVRADLLRVDRLAVRMRRNGDSLLVLAGRDIERQTRHPMRLSDVVRIAASETDHDNRVRLALDVDPPVVANAAPAMAHLLAELIENASTFSAAGTPVTVAANVTGDRLRMRIIDIGVGMCTEELALANDRLAAREPDPSQQPTSSQRVGLVVAGRLAARLEARVELAAESASGTVAILDLPPAMFAEGSLTGTDRVPPLPRRTPVLDLTEPRPRGGARHAISKVCDAPPTEAGAEAPTEVGTEACTARLASMDVLPRRGARAGFRLGRRGMPRRIPPEALRRDPAVPQGDSSSQPSSAPQIQSMDWRSAAASEALAELSRLSTFTSPGDKSASAP